jgi:hypothetical protein
MPPLVQCKIRCLQDRSHSHTYGIGELEDGPGDLLGKGKFSIEHSEKFVVSFTVPIFVAPKRARGDIRHRVFFARDVEWG